MAKIPNRWFIGLWWHLYHQRDPTGVLFLIAHLSSLSTYAHREGAQEDAGGPALSLSTLFLWDRVFYWPWCWAGGQQSSRLCPWWHRSYRSPWPCLAFPWVLIFKLAQVFFSTEPSLGPSLLLSLPSLPSVSLILETNSCSVASKWKSSCFSLPSVGITGVQHFHARLESSLPLTSIPTWHCSYLQVRQNLAQLQ